MNRTRISRRHLLAWAFAAGTGVVLPAAHPPVLAQTYPDKPIRFVVPYPAGGGTDILGRLLATRLQDAWKVAITVENRTGASGMIGNEFVAKSVPDGSTVLIGITALIQGPALFPKLPYDPIGDFVPVTGIARSQDLLVVPAAFPASTVPEFVALLKAHPGRYSIGNYGTGTSGHIHAEMFAGQAQVVFNGIPYRGSSPMITDLLGGTLTAAFVDSASIHPQMAGGRFKVLAVSGTRNSPLAPQAPTLTSLGFQAFEPYGWFGVFLPAGAPQAVTQKLSDELVRIINLPDVQERIRGMGLVPNGNGAGAFAQEVRTDKEVWARVIRDAKIKVD